MNSNPVYLNVAEEITKRINSGIYPIGSKLPAERDLTESLNVSRSSLREAIRVLNQEGLISNQPRGGRFILRAKSVSEESNLLSLQMENARIADLLEARETFDEAIIPLACERASDNDMKEIDEAFKKMQEFISAPNLPMLSADSLFHLAVAKASHNSVFVSMFTANLEIFNKLYLVTLTVPGRKKEVLKEHADIYFAVRERDALTARLAARIHLRNICRRYDSVKNKSLSELQGKYMCNLEKFTKK